MFSVDLSGIFVRETREPDVATLGGRERRESERVIAYWEDKVARLGGDATLAALDLNRMRSPEWSHRFVIAVDPEPEDSALLYYGADFARLLDLPGQRTPRFPIARQLRKRLSDLFVDGGGDAELIRSPNKWAPHAPRVQQLPRRFSDVFMRGCTDARSRMTPVRIEGTVERADGGRELYRAAFIPVQAQVKNNPLAHLAFGAFSSRVSQPALAA